MALVSGPRPLPTAGPGGGIELGASDQRAGFDQLLAYLGIGENLGSGPFDDFFESAMGPIATAAINAMGMRNGGELPIDLSGLYDTIRQGMGVGGGGINIYDYLRNLGREGIAAALSGPEGGNFNSTKATLQTLAPLMTSGMWGGRRNAFYTDQNNVLRAMQRNSLMDPGGMLGARGPEGNSGPTWGEYVQRDPFFNNYYGGRKPANGMGQGLGGGVNDGGGGNY